MSEKMPLLRVENLSVCLAATGRSIVSSAGFALHEGECLGIVGESGAGKSVMTLSAVGLQPRTLSVCGRSLWKGEDLLAMPAKRRVGLYGRQILLIVQQPMSAFDPLIRIGHQLVESVRCVNPSLGTSQARSQAEQALAALRFEDPARIMRSFPCELSGGQLQRCMLATVRLLKPSLVIADEPTSALDVLSGKEVVNEFIRMRKELGVALILITHDLGVVQKLADQIVVMRRGTLIEQGGPQVLIDPQHEYTRYLVGTRVALARAFNRLTGAAESGHE